jgi:hypothetical protein
MMRRVLCCLPFALLVLLAAARCFNPNTSTVHYSCQDNAPGMCPPGLQCIGGLCAVDGDGGGTAVDAAVPDGAPPADLTVRGCVGAGHPVGNGLWACDGPWEVGQAGALCAPGFELPRSAGLLDFNTCNALRSFYLVLRAPSSNDSFPWCPGAGYTCDTKGMYQYRPGCGGKTPDATKFRLCNGLCGGLGQALPCSESPPWGYTCNMVDSLRDRNTNPEIGVICAPKM